MKEDVRLALGEEPAAREPAGGGDRSVAGSREFSTNRLGFTCMALLKPGQDLDVATLDEPFRIGAPVVRLGN